MLFSPAKRERFTQLSNARCVGRGSRVFKVLFLVDQNDVLIARAVSVF